MANRHGDPVWYELLTRAPERAAAFYGALLGWTIRDSDAGRPGYRLLLAGEDMVGGLFPATAEMPVGWLSYTAVGDVDAAAASTAAAGGKVLAGPMDNPAAGRLAVLTDPQGAMFALMSLQDGWESHAFEDSPGHCRWNELTTSDQTAALGFYGALFGWTAGGGMPISPEQGDYRFIQQGETVLGAVMNGDASAPPPAWLFYFGVDDVAAAVARLTAAGGKVRVGPVEVPGGDWIVVASDPEGAAFGLVGPKGGRVMEVVQTLWFANGMDAALTFYTSLIPGSGIDTQWTMAADSPAGPAGSVRVATFHLGDQRYQAMEAGDGEPFTPAFSITLLCDDQAEVDRLWSAIADGGGTPVECGWIRDRWGLSWQVVPRRLIELMSQPDKEAARRTAEAMMRMVKFDIASLEAASAG